MLSGEAGPPRARHLLARLGRYEGGGGARGSQGGAAESQGKGKLKRGRSCGLGAMVGREWAVHAVPCVGNGDGGWGWAGCER